MNRNELRPCVVKFPAITVKRFAKGDMRTDILKPEEEKRALFHRWSEEKTVVAESCLIGGAPAGQISYTYGIVEYEDGRVDCVNPQQIIFSDRPDHETKPVYGTITDIVNQLESCGYTCEGGPLEMNMAFVKLKEISDLEKAGAKVMIKRSE